MTCPSCGHENVSGARFCAKCGSELDSPDHPVEAGWSPFKKAFLWTVIPIGTLSVASAVGVAGGNALHDQDNLLFLGFFLWSGAALGWVVAVLAAIGFAIASKRQAASGILAGIGVGFMALAVTCFANIAGSF